MSRFFLALAPFAALCLAGCAPSEEEDVLESIEEAEPRSPAAEALEASLLEIGEGFVGDVGIAVRDVQTGELAHFNGLALFPQQSVSKLWVALTALELADRGELDLADPITIGRVDLTLFHQPIRNEVQRLGSHTATVGDLMARAIVESDNTANDALLRRAGGPDAVRRFLDRHGLQSIRFGPGEREMQSAIAGLEWHQGYSIGRSFYEARERVPDAVRSQAFEAYVADPVDGAPPAAIAEALALLVRGELVSQASTAFLLDLMERARSGPNRLKGGLPPGWTIGHKTGTGQVWRAEQSGYNDVGVITAPGGERYAVVVMIARTAEPIPARMAMMHEVVRAVADYSAQVEKREP